MNLNRSSSGHIIAELTADGLVREVDEDEAVRRNHARAGRPSVLLELVPEAVLFQASRSASSILPPCK